MVADSWVEYWTWLDVSMANYHKENLQRPPFKGTYTLHAGLPTSHMYCEVFWQWFSKGPFDVFDLTTVSTIFWMLQHFDSDDVNPGIFYY